MSSWSDMNATQRNHFVGELIAAAPLTQCYLAVDGKRVLITPYTEDQRGKVDAMLLAFRASDDVWAEFKKSHSDATDDWRTKLEIDVERWHIRYSDTPGGAWLVVEWLREQGFVVTIEAHAFGYDAKSFIMHPKDGEEEFRDTGTDFPRVICELLLNIKAPEALA